MQTLLVGGNQSIFRQAIPTTYPTNYPWILPREMFKHNRLLELEVSVLKWAIGFRACTYCEAVVEHMQDHPGWMRN